MLFAMTSLSDVNRCCEEGGSANTDAGNNSDEDCESCGCGGKMGVTGAPGVAGDGDLSSGGGNVGILSMTEGGESGRSGSESGSESGGSAARPNLFTLLRSVERGMP